MLLKRVLFYILLGYVAVSLTIYIQMLMHHRNSNIVDMKEFVCVIEKTKCRIIWVKDKAMVEKLLGCKWEEMYYYLYPIDILGNSVVSVPWRPLKCNHDGLFQIDKELINLPPEIKPETNFKFYNPNTKEYVVFTIDFSKKQYKIAGPKKDFLIEQSLLDQ